MNDTNDNDNAFYLAVSHHGTALIPKQARKPEVVSKTLVAGADGNEVPCNGHDSELLVVPGLHV